MDTFTNLIGGLSVSSQSTRTLPVFRDSGKSSLQACTGGRGGVATKRALRSEV